ncbi:hypothetical protein IMSAG013_00661 [Clostridiales bacterium]|nr:hypothetical protein IMSAG013_00661 [Clostridiales bacterium]
MQIGTIEPICPCLWVILFYDAGCNMKVPGLRENKRSKTMVSAFTGLDRRPKPSAGGFVDMQNMTGKQYPKISVRDRRGRMSLVNDNIYGLSSLDLCLDDVIHQNALVAVRESTIRAFYYKNDGVLHWKDIAGSTIFASCGTKKTGVVSGGYVYYFPDKFYVNLMDLTDLGKLEQTATLQTGAVTSEAGSGYYEVVLEPCDIDGNPVEGETSYVRLIRKRYTLPGGSKGEYEGNMAYAGGFSEMDTVTISGFTDKKWNGDYILHKVDPLNQFIVLSGSGNVMQANGISVKIARLVPEMDYVVAAGNRLWGCRYGVDKYGKPINEIYASALGDPKNWSRFMGVSTDSWRASVGTCGVFTGAVCYDGKPVFFKEDAIIKIYGDYPGEFTMTEHALRGIENGSAKSAVVVNDVLYYKSANGVVKYDGGIPVNIDTALGNTRWKNAVAGGVDNRYFISMENSTGRRSLFTYDTVKKIWCREDDIPVTEFCRCGRELYILCEGEEKNEVYTACGSYNGLDTVNPGGAEDVISWYCETAELEYEAPDHVYVTMLQIRLEIPFGSRVQIDVEYDSDGIWRRQHVISGKKKSMVQIPLRPHRCDHFRIRISGTGDAAICSIAKVTENCSGKGWHA